MKKYMNKEEIEQIQFEQTKSLLFQLQEANSKIEKIREYIEHEYFKRTQIGITDKDFQEFEIKNILSIIDGSDE